MRRTVNASGPSLASRSAAAFISAELVVSVVTGAPCHVDPF